MTPFSVMMPVTRLWGVTSKAGLQTSTDSGAVRVPYRAVSYTHLTLPTIA